MGLQKASLPTQSAQNGMAQFIVDGSAQMAFAGGIFNEHHFPSTNHPGFPITGGNLHTLVKVDNVLPPWGGMPVQMMGRLLFEAARDQNSAT